MNLFWITNNTGTRGWRVTPIMEALRAEGHACEYANLPRFTDEQMSKILEWADVIIFQMVASRPLLQQAKEQGIYTIFDCDDLIEEVPPKHPSKEVTKGRAYQSLFRDMVKEADCVIVSSQPLYDLYIEKNANTILLPNYLPDGFWEKPFSPNTSKTIRLGWAGGISHAEDLDFIAPVICNIMAKYPDVKLVYTGGGGWASNPNNPNDFVRYGEDSFSSIPLQRREYNQGSRLEMWPDRLNSMRLDIAIAPLDNNRFSRAKTHIKALEYGINHWPGVYQEFLYKDAVVEGKTGFLASTREEWEDRISYLIENPDERRKLGETAYEYVKANHTFSGERREQWLTVYREAIAGSRKGQGATSFFVGNRA